MFGCETTKHPTDKYIRHAHTHTHRQHTATYQINNLTTQTSREGSNSNKHKRRPPEDSQTVVTETCRVLTLRLLMSYIYMERIFLMFLHHTRRRSTVGRAPLDE